MKEKCCSRAPDSHAQPHANRKACRRCSLPRAPGRQLGTQGGGQGSVGRGAGFKWCKARTQMTFCHEGSTLQIATGPGEKENIIFTFNCSKRARCR